MLQETPRQVRTSKANKRKIVVRIPSGLETAGSCLCAYCARRGEFVGGTV